MAMALHTLADDFAVKHIERRQKGGDAVSLTVVCRQARPFFIGSPGWDRSSAWILLFSSTERTMARSGGLTYRLDDLFELGRELWIVRQLEPRTRSGRRP